MPTGDMIFLAGVILAFGTFAIVLALADARTRSAGK